MNNRNMNIKIRRLITLMMLSLVVSVSPVRAQSTCGIENTAFKGGEFLNYDLFFNWKFIWV